MKKIISKNGSYLLHSKRYVITATRCNSYLRVTIKFKEEKPYFRDLINDVKKMTDLIKDEANIKPNETIPNIV